MSVATTRPAQLSNIRIPVLTPMYGAPHESFCAMSDGTYRCGSGQGNEFLLEFSGAPAAHCSFVRKVGTFSVNRIDGRVWVNDLPVNGVTRLTEGDVISLGPVAYRLEYQDASASQPELDDRPLTAVKSASISAQRPPVDHPPEFPQRSVIVDAAVVTDTFPHTALQKELEEHQRLLALRQQQLAELTEMVRERERNADSRLAAIEERASKMTAQWDELIAKQEQLAKHEREQTRRSEEVERQLQTVANEQRQLADAARQNSLTLAAAEQAQLELTQQEAVLRPLLAQTQAANADLLQRESLLQSRESGMQQQHEEYARREVELSQRDLELLAKAKSLTEQDVAIADRAQALADAERESANAASTAADALSMEQLATIAEQTETAVREREQTELAQNKLLRLQESLENQVLELQVRESEIESRANEVSARLLTLKTLKREQSTAPVIVAEPATPLVDSEAIENQAAALREEREELDRRAAELAAAEARFSETRKSANLVVQAAESERSALQSANKDLLCERNALSQLRQDLASRESGISEREVLVARQLEDMRSRFAVLDLRAAELKHHESEIDSRAADVHRRIQHLKNERRAHTETIQEKQPDEGSDTAAARNDGELLEIRQQLNDMQLAATTADEERESMLAEREALLSAVRELQTALQNAHQDVEEANRLKEESGLLEERLEQAQQTIADHSQNLQSSESNLSQISEQLESLRTELAECVQERDELITSMAEISKSNSAESTDSGTRAESIPAGTYESFSRELDQRAELLDRRDEELRERTRKIELTEGDIESQRRQLLEARQQLELARAEIQVAIRRQPEPAPQATSTTPAQRINSAVTAERENDRSFAQEENPDRDQNDSESSGSSPVPETDLRAELAGLFGLRKPAADSVTPPPLPSAEFVDLSEPAGENQSVKFHFGSETAQFAATQFEPACDNDPEPVREENSDDVVRDYMEQLLSRSRKNAGTALPGELKAAENKKGPAAASSAKPAEEPARKSTPKVKSYIDQYMSGNMGDLEDNKPLAMSPPDSHDEGVTPVVPKRVVQPRTKMDLLKLKENMDSFRTLSTQSVENALASHAIKVERLGFSGRTVFAVLLLLMTLFLAIANSQGAIDAPMLIWVTLTSAIAILAELYRRYSAIAVHTRNPLDLLFSSKPSKNNVPQSAKPTNSTSAVKATAADEETVPAEVDDDGVKPSQSHDTLNASLEESSTV